jgi:RNA polymerase sigma-70 factor (ECF subfamily)
MLEHSDEDLIDRAAAGGVDAFTELLRRHDPLVRRYAYRLLAGDLGLAEDALQDAYVKAFRNIGRFRREAAFGTWLHRIVHSACVDILRRRRSIAPTERLEHGESADHADPAIDRLAIALALDGLSVAHRAVVLLVDAHGLDYQEAADVLGVPVGTVRSRLARARRSLRAALEDHR